MPFRTALGLLIPVAAIWLASAWTLAQIETRPEPADTDALQREMIARLAGHETGRAVARSSPAERAATAAFLVDAFDALGLEPQRHEYRLPNKNGFIDLLMPPYRGVNVYTVIEATGPSNAYAVVGAHYDSEPGSPGAVDNASGVALVYALAARLAKLETRRLNYLLVLFDQEEDGEVGSSAFSAYLQEREYRVHSVHITDLVGWDEDGDRAVEIQAPGPYLEARYRAAATRLGIPLHVTTGASSDTWPFRKKGFRAVGVWEEVANGDSTPHLHRSSDTYETVDFAFLASTTALVFDVLANLTEEPDHEP